LNSRLSNFSTADCRSAKVSYSTNLCRGLAVFVTNNPEKFLPSTIAISTDFRIDNVQSRLAGEIFQILEARVSPVNPDERTSQTEKEAIQVHTPEIQNDDISPNMSKESFSQKKTEKAMQREKLEDQQLQAMVPKLLILKNVHNPQR
jgi:hypothetical protein